MTTFQLEDAILRSLPFRHLIVLDSLEPGCAETLLAWLEATSAWQLKSEEGSYEFEGFDLRSVALPQDLDWLLHPGVLSDLREQLETAFGASLPTKVGVAVQKLCPPQRILIHTDYRPGRETHRFIVALNRGWAAPDGGLLMMFGADDGQELQMPDRCYLPVHRSAVAIEISQLSHHAVTPVVSGSRYSLCISFGE